MFTGTQPCIPPMYTAVFTAHIREPFTACVYVEFTARVHSLIHLHVYRPCTWICLRPMYTGRPCLRPVHTPVYTGCGRVRAVYTATAAYTAMYRPCPRPCTSRIHVRVQYTAPVHVHVHLRVHGQHRYCHFYSTNNNKNQTTTTRMWANAKRDGCRAEYRWRPLFNAAKFG